MYDDNLRLAVAQLAAVTEGLPDQVLGQDWTWRDHDEGVRFALIGSYHELRDLAVVLREERQKTEGPEPITSAQYMLGQYHGAYRDLQAVLLGVEDDILDTPPDEGDWPLRRILGHIIGADSLFYILVHYAVEWARAGQEPRKITGEDADELVGTEEKFDSMLATQGLGGILDYFESLHNQITMEVAGWGAADLEALSPFWEGQPMPVHYRLHRFDAHLIQHTVQVEKTLQALGRTPNEAKRLLRLVYKALAEAESALIGSWDLKSSARQYVTATIAARAGEVREITSD